MAPYRTSRTGNQRRTISQPDHDVFEGLPVRHWRKRPISVSTNVERTDPNANPVLPSGYPELPMPKDAHQLSENCFALLRAARMGMIRKDVAEGGEDGRKGRDSDGSVDEQNTLLTRKWALIPKETEEPEPEYLAKRRKGLPSLYGVDAVPKTKAGPMRKTKIRKLDTGGKNHVWEVLVPEGQSLDGEIGEDIISPTEVPLPGTVVEGLGVANANGVVVAGNQTGQTPPRRKPPPPRRKQKGRPPHRDRKKVAFAPEANGVTVPDGAISEGVAALDHDDPSLEAFPNSDGNLVADEDSLMQDAGQDGEDESDLGDENDESREDQTNSHASPAPGDGQETAQGLPIVKDSKVLEPRRIDDVELPLTASPTVKGPSGVDTEGVVGSDPVPSTTDISDFRAEDTPDSIYETTGSVGPGALVGDLPSIAGLDHPILEAQADSVSPGAKEEPIVKDQHHPNVISDISLENLDAKSKSPTQPSPVPTDVQIGGQDQIVVDAPPSVSEQPIDDLNEPKDPPSSASSGPVRSTPESDPHIPTTDAAVPTIVETQDDTRSDPHDPDTPMLESRLKVHDPVADEHPSTDSASAPQDSAVADAPPVVAAEAIEAPTPDVVDQEPPAPAQTSQLTASPPQPRSVPLPQQFNTPNAPTPSPPTPVTNSFELKRTPLDSPRAPTMSPPTPAGDRSRTPDGQVTSKPPLLQPSTFALDPSPSSSPDHQKQQQAAPLSTLPGLSAVDVAAAAPPPPPPPALVQPSPPATNTTTVTTTTITTASASVQEVNPIKENNIAVEAAPLVPNPHFDAEIPHAHNPLDGLAAPAPSTVHTDSNTNADAKGDSINKTGVDPHADGGDDDNGDTTARSVVDDGEVDLLGDFEKSLAAGSGSAGGAGDGEGEGTGEGEGLKGEN